MMIVRTSMKKSFKVSNLSRVQIVVMFTTYMYIKTKVRLEIEKSFQPLFLTAGEVIEHQS